MLTKEDLREAVYKMADAADETTLIYMLSAELARREDDKIRGRYSATDLTSFQQEHDAYISGEGTTYSAEEFWDIIRQQTGYQRKGNAA